MSNNSTLAIALASLLVGGVAVAAFQHSRTPAQPETAAAAAPAAQQLLDGDAPADDASVAPSAPVLDYAQVVAVKPVTRKEKLYAQVIGTEPVRETSTVSTPHEVCNDVVVQERLPERDGNVGGTVAGAVIGGLIGNQVGGGKGKKLATVAGAVGGGFAGREIDRRHVGGQVVNRTERQCHTETSTSEATRVVAYKVTYRNPDGTTGSTRMDSRPGSRILLGSENRTVGYDVTYRYDGAEHTVRMDDKPAGDRLPVVDGKLVTQVAAMDDGSSRQ
ncbi:MAG TPA: glycine zipper 2TM domain-containing protein [Xanthomonadaceae bacterium]|nr:glycine zipper 2TM domain-containing protein [Xanthomonadaceae bacterium]